MHPANGRRCYNVTSSLIGWAHTKWSLPKFCQNQCWDVIIDQFHKSHDVSIPCPTMHHPEQKYGHFCPEWCIVGYDTGALWDLWVRSIKNPQNNTHRNPLFPSKENVWRLELIHCDVIWWFTDKSRSTLIQVISCCWMATLTNVGLLSKVFCDIHLRAISLEVRMNLIRNICVPKLHI